MLAVVRFILLLLPSALGTRLVIMLSGKKFVYRLKEQERQWLQRVERFSYAEDKIAWRTGEGPLVVLVHGYGGCAAQLYKIADALVEVGYSVVAPDITSHGSSAGEKISFRDFIDDVKLLQDYLKEDVYAYVGHSAGAMCLMAGRRIRGLEAKKYVCIAMPSYPYPPVRAIERRLAPPSRVMRGYQAFLGKQFEGEWDRLVESIFDYRAGDNLLLVYDENDRYLIPGDVENVKRYWPDAEMLVTDDAGHEEVLRSDVCVGRVVEFMR